MDLVDLESGRSLHVSSFENPQRFGGSDIMNRISYDGGQDARGELQRSVVSAINFEILEMVRLLDFTRQEIYEIAVAGNSTMRDLLFKLDVQGIGQRPTSRWWSSSTWPVSAPRRRWSRSPGGSVFGPT